VVRAPARQPYLIMGYKTPAVTTAKEEWEPYALEVLAAILDGGYSARLSRKLIRGQEIAVSAGAGYSAFSRLSGMFSMSGIPSEGRSVDELEQALKAEIKLLQQELVSQAELDRVQAQVVAAEVYALDSVYYQAMQIGILETLGLGWELLDQYSARINAVTAEQVQQVARRYLQDDQLTVAVLEPLPLEPEQPKPAAAGGRHGH
jgi:zinc protease